MRHIKRTFAVVLVFALAALLVVLEEDGRDEGLQVHQVLVEVAGVFILPDPALQVVLSGFAGGENIDAGAVLWVGGDMTALKKQRSLPREEHGLD